MFPLRFTISYIIFPEPLQFGQVIISYPTCTHTPLHLLITNFCSKYSTFISPNTSVFGTMYLVAKWQLSAM